MHQAKTRYSKLSQKQLLADLNWVLRSELLLKQSPPEHELELYKGLIKDESMYNKWFDSLLDDPSSLIKFFDSDEQLILGKYFERLYHFFFLNYPLYEIIEYGKQLIVDGNTLGEIDFIIKDRKANKILHIEVAVKYYLSFKNSRKHDMWIGPNGLDTLAKKMSKFSRQIKLSKEHKKLINGVEVDEQKVIIKGYLFQHCKGENWPFFVNDRVGKGGWMYENEAEQYITDEYRYVILPKKNWLSFYIPPDIEVMSKKELLAETHRQIQKIQKGIMLAAIDMSNYEIIEKLMVLPQKWPKL